MNEGSVSRHLWLEGRPAIAEEIMVMRDAMLAEETGARSISATCPPPGAWRLSAR